jgi:hypothetical protein
MVIRDVRPRCQSPKYQKKGHLHSGTQHHQGGECGRQFVQYCEPYLMAEDTRVLVERVLGLRSTEHTFISSILSYVGIDPQKEVHWVAQPFEASTQRFAEGTIDAVAAQPSQSQELWARRLGHMLVNSTVDRSWSQYYCCIVYTHQTFAR